MKTKVLVTGATGFVGSHIMESLAGEQGVQIIAACRNPSRLPPMAAAIEIRVGDMRDAAYRSQVVRGVDVVCHAAAWTSLWNHERESRILYRDPSIAMIEAAKAAGVKRFINTSTTSSAAPESSANPDSQGIPRTFWPHLGNVVAIENRLREVASPGFQVINLRLGIFAGHRYGLGLLPILAPRLKTHLVPWVGGGRTGLPVVDGRDIGQAFARAVLAPGLGAYEGFNIVGPEVPTVREVIDFLYEEFDLPRPHFGVPFGIAYLFAGLMEKLNPFVPWEPLVTRSIIHLMEETAANNEKAARLLGYRPVHSWRDAVRAQMWEMAIRQLRPMSLAKEVTK